MLASYSQGLDHHEGVESSYEPQHPEPNQQFVEPSPPPAPQAASEVAPQAAPQLAPQVAPDIAPQAAPQVVPVAAAVNDSYNSQWEKQAALPSTAAAAVVNQLDVEGEPHPTKQPSGSVFGDSPIGKSDYNAEAEYDSCREWLRLLVAFAAMVLAMGAAYPIKLGIDCYRDNSVDGKVDLTECKDLFTVPYSLTVLAVALGVELAMILLFFYTCRHEFCGRKRKYTTGLLFCTGKSSTVTVYPSPSPHKAAPEPSILYD